MVEVMKKVSKDYVENAKMARKIWPGAVVLDVTLDGGMKKFDPAFPVGKIDIPGIKKMRSMSVMGIWEGLKIFKKKEVIDEKWFVNEKKLGVERKSKSYGELVGIKVGEEVMDVESAKIEVFKKIYKEVILKNFGVEIEGIREVSKKKNVVLLDYMEGKEKYPLSHVDILKEIIENVNE